MTDRDDTTSVDHDDDTFTEGAPLVTRADFDIAAQSRAELLSPPTAPAAPSPHPTPAPRAATLSSDERRVWTAPLTLVASELAAVPRPAVLTGESWRASCRGRRGRCGRCWLCEWEQQADRLARPQREDPRRTAKTVNEWFEAWCAYREDPHGAKSSIGIQLDRIAAGMTHGGSFVAREPSAIRAATLFVAVEASMLEAASHARGDNQRMSAGSVLDGLRALIVGLAVSRAKSSSKASSKQTMAKASKASKQTRGVGGRAATRGVVRTPMAIEEVAARWSDASEAEGGERVTARAAKHLVGRWRRLAAVELAARGLMRARRGDEDAVERVRDRLMEGRVTG